MIDEPALRRAFSDFAEALLERYDIGHMLYRLTDQAVEVLGVEGAGVSLRGGPDELQFVTATDDRSSRAERAQIDAADGPCYEAFRSGRIVTVTDLEQDARWPGFRETALEQGFHGAAGIPMPVSSEPIGALNLYASSAREWQQEELDVAQLLANVASGYVLNWRSLHEKETLASQLQEALDSRVIIEQAKGILAERHGLDAGGAFQRLRRHSRDTSTELHEVARQVVAGRLEL
ncbi:MAG: GAF and ANTAR domain-containing protein [Actinobacteria bacterium]|nr:GAF and ANTAR domain-containing protein [Actinomycetota bacterium]